MASSAQLLVSTVFMLCSQSLAYYLYQSKLPNGQQIPHPCKPNYIWHGVGHISPLGGGHRNQFGKDFARFNHTWTADLCRLDSDGDGLTNGQELGDPDCVWREGELPRHDNVTHPGVCDPWGSPECSTKNTWVSCDVGEFKCDAINEPDVRNLTLRIPRTKVPAQDTTYVCYVIDVPDDQEYHLIATKPYIDNPNVMHHMGLMTCGDHAPETPEPQHCGMGFPGCSSLIALWTLGMSGQCIDPQTGFLFGKGHARRVALQFHWTNVHHVDHWDDASGLTIFFTPRLRRYNAGMAIWGQEFLEIPPGQPIVTASGGCSADCTRNHVLSSPIYVTTALNHMHYLGTAGKTEIIRTNGSVDNLATDRPYGYDNPHLHEFPNPVPVYPGDEVRVHCEYSSLSRGGSTMWGEGTNDEMCYVIVSYYPAESFSGFCNQWKNIDKCSLKSRGCNFQTFLNSSKPESKEIIDMDNRKNLTGLN
nr:hypothetical protein BaRGS_013943 [Batillaria attramentaria]